MPVNEGSADMLNIQAEIQKANSALSVRRYDLAIEIIQRVLGVEPENSQAFYTLGRAYILKHELVQARVVLRESLRFNSSYSPAHALYGSVLMKIGHYEQAEQEMLIALQLDPSSPYAHFVYAGFLLELNLKKHLVEARHHIVKALELDPQDANYHHLFGQILAAEGNLSAAETAYRQALSFEPENTQVHNSYGVLLYNRRNNPLAAFEHFRVALMQEPGNEKIKKNFLMALKAKNKFYWLFWNYYRLLRKLGPLGAIAVGGAIMILLSICISSVGGPDFLSTMMGMSILLVLIRLVDPLFNFLVKRGWIK